MWDSEWNAISARILSLIDAGMVFLKAGENDNYDVSDVLLRNANETAASLRNLLSGHKQHLPDSAATSLERFVSDFDRRFRGTIKPVGFTGVAGVLPLLASFRAEFQYLLADTESVARSLVVRAFAHLQRSIVADEAIQKRWQSAFSNGETHCEGLGACHLLWHGIWAFKTSARGQRTDLVLGTPLEVVNDVRRAANTLVLTEWKIVRSPSELSRKADEAYGQAKRYCEGILAGFELASQRFLVLVSDDRLEMPQPRREDNTIYEFRNVAVSPRTPSGRPRAQ